MWRVPTKVDILKSQRNSKFAIKNGCGAVFSALCVRDPATFECDARQQSWKFSKELCFAKLTIAKRRKNSLLRTVCTRRLNRMRANAGDNSQKSARCNFYYQKLLESWLSRIVFARLCEFWMRHAPTQVTILKSHLIARFTIEKGHRRSFWEFRANSGDDSIKSAHCQTK